MGQLGTLCTSCSPLDHTVLCNLRVLWLCLTPRSEQPFLAQMGEGKCHSVQETRKASAQNRCHTATMHRQIQSMQPFKSWTSLMNLYPHTTQKGRLLRRQKHQQHTMRR